MRVLRAFIDESGQRGMGDGASDHFVMGSALFFEESADHASELLAKIRRQTNRGEGHELHWNKMAPRHKKTAASILVADSSCVRYCSVVVCKRELLRGEGFNQDMAYLLTFRYLLERLSWIARQSDAVLEYTLAHTKNFKLAKLREYEANLRAESAEDCKVAWSHVAASGGSLDQPKRNEFLQLADMASSAIGDAFNGDTAGITERSYLELLSPYLYRGPRGAGSLTSYGLKMHPWRLTTKAAYPWVAAL